MCRHEDAVLDRTASVYVATTCLFVRTVAVVPAAAAAGTSGARRGARCRAGERERGKPLALATTDGRELAGDTTMR
jgi:hypothetical protein